MCAEPLVLSAEHAHLALQLDRHVLPYVHRLEEHAEHLEEAARSADALADPAVAARIRWLAGLTRIVADASGQLRTEADT